MYFFVFTNAMQFAAMRIRTVRCMNTHAHMHTFSFAYMKLLLMHSTHSSLKQHILAAAHKNCALQLKRQNQKHIDCSLLCTNTCTHSIMYSLLWQNNENISEEEEKKIAVATTTTPAA